MVVALLFRTRIPDKLNAKILSCQLKACWHDRILALSLSGIRVAKQLHRGIDVLSSIAG
jgi:hypothetical protein